MDESERPSKKRRIAGEGEGEGEDEVSLGIDTDQPARSQSGLESLDREITPPLRVRAGVGVVKVTPRGNSADEGRGGARERRDDGEGSETESESDGDGGATEREPEGELDEAEAETEMDGQSRVAEDEIQGQGDVAKSDIQRKGDVAERATISSTGPEFLPSPIQLTRIKDLPDHSNIDTVSVDDILGDVLIKECWQFNYLFDINFVMNALDSDVRRLVQVKIIHGFWKQEDQRRAQMENSAKHYPNVQLISAHLPEPFGTHHSKMMILIRHDDTAQVVIHTANMIRQDWRNLCQAVWRSPLLPLLSNRTGPEDRTSTGEIGTGQRFKFDLLRYFKAYGGRTRNLVDQLKQYDFGSIRAALITSTPGRTRLNPSPSQTSWGWPGLKQILSTIPCHESKDNEVANIISQVSSIATLSEKWLGNFFDVLSSHSETSAQSSAPRTFTRTVGDKPKKPKFNIIFPTASEIRESLDGYESGASIHMKIQSAAQIKQLNLLRPMLCHWNREIDTSSTSKSEAPPQVPPSSLGIQKLAKEIPIRIGESYPSAQPLTTEEIQTRQALRNQAAPHIKTYLRFSTPEKTEIEWAMVTSANLSQQAWGAVEDKDGVVRVCSYEVGVVVWPALFADEGEKEAIKMVPTFGRDMPNEGDMNVSGSSKKADTSDDIREREMEEVVVTESDKRKAVVGFRMPYDLPLHPYKRDEVPWCASAEHLEPDWKNVIWEGYGSRV